MASQSGGSDKLEKDLARFGFKGPGIRHTDKEHFDIMAGEFPIYNAQIETINANEEEILRIGREARDARFVGTASGRIARAVGSLSDGSGYLVDAQGKPINRTPQAPITPMSRKAKDWWTMASKHTGAAENMMSGGPDESMVSRQNAPLRDLHKSGHDLNHTFKNPVAAVSPDVKAAGTNHSYLHPHSHAGMREVPRKAFDKANVIKPVSQMGTGKT